MFKSVFSVSAIVAAGLFFALSVQVAQGQEVSEADIRGLSGYKSYSTLGSFTERLRQDQALFSALQGNEALAERILGSTMAQRQVLSKIESSGDVQQALSEFSDGTDVNSFSSRSAQSENREHEKTLTSQSVSDSTGNLAAQRALERAQREREAANQRANDIMAQAREIMDRKQRNEELARQQEEIIASNEAVAAVMAELADQPEALQAFLSDGALVQKVMDKAVTLFEALEQVGADINKDTASAGDAAVAENDTPVTDPAPDSRQQSLDDLMSTLKQVNPQAHTLLSQDSALQDSVLSGDITFDELLAKLTTRLEQEAASPDPSSSSDPVPTRPSEPEDVELVHVSGNHYKLGDKDVYDLNHIPARTEAAKDANGWPKYLNVPAECPGPKEGEVYYHAARYHADAEAPYGGNIKSFASSYLEVHDGSAFRIGMTDEETNASAFVTPNTDGWKAGLKFALLANDPHDGSGKNITTQMTISHCPGDFSGSVVPSGKEDLPDACIQNTGNMNVATIYEGDELHGKMAPFICMLRPGQRYFFNMATPGNPAPEDPDSIETRNADFLQKMKELWDIDPHRRGGRLVGVRMAVSTIHQGPNTVYLPDAKACVGINEPKPLHYFESFASHIMPFRDRTCGRRQGGAVGGFKAQSGPTPVICYDPYDIIPSQAFRPENVHSPSETDPTKMEHVWVEGYGKPLYSIYRCENTQAEDSRSIGYKYPLWGSPPACAAHREGEAISSNGFRKRSRGSNIRYSYVQQCQFDNERQRFDWVAVTARKKLLDVSGQFTKNSTFKGALMEIDNDKCVVMGRRYKVGDEATVSCDNENRVLQCQQRADNGAPVMVAKDTGWDLSRLYTTDGKNIVGACSIKPR